MAKNKTKSTPARKKPKAAPAAAKAPSAPAAVKGSSTMEKPSKKNALRESILARKAATKPITFSLDEVRAIAKTNAARSVEAPGKAAKPGAKPAALADPPRMAP